MEEDMPAVLQVFEVLATDGSLQPQGLSHAVLIHVKLGQLVHASALLQSHSSLARDFSFADQADLFHLAMHSDHEATSLSLAQQLLLLGLHQKHPKATAQGAGLIAAFLKVGELQAAFQVRRNSIASFLLLWLICFMLDTSMHVLFMTNLQQAAAAKHLLYHDICQYQVIMQEHTGDSFLL